MSDEEILIMAKVDVSNLVDDVLLSLQGFAQDYHYQPEWVYEEFKKQLNERIKE